MNRAVSLLETVIAMFVLIGAVLVIVSLFHSSLRYSTMVESRQLATVVAEKKLAQIRAWSRQPTPGGFNYDTIDTYPKGPAPDPDYPAFTVTTEVKDQLQASPCTTAESLHGARARFMRQSVKLVRVTVSWHARDPSKRVRLTSWVAEPPRGPCTLVLSPASPPVPVPRHDPPNSLGAVTFTVKAVDRNNRTIDDVFFNWSWKPGTGKGTLAVNNRSGTSATFTNRISKDPFWTGGECTAAVRAVYCGRPSSLPDIVLMLEALPPPPSPSPSPSP